MKAYIQVRDSAWDAFMALDHETLKAQNADAARLRRTKALVTGYWNGTVGFTVVNAIGTEAQLDSFYNYFVPSDTLGFWKWGEDGKVDFVTEYTGQHDDLLFLHKDIVVYGPRGQPKILQAPTFENPNWANDWAGSKQNRFARSFDRSFDGSFG